MYFYIKSWYQEFLIALVFFFRFFYLFSFSFNPDERLLASIDNDRKLRENYLGQIFGSEATI